MNNFAHCLLNGTTEQQEIALNILLSIDEPSEFQQIVTELKSELDNSEYHTIHIYNEYTDDYSRIIELKKEGKNLFFSLPVVDPYDPDKITQISFANKISAYEVETVWLNNFLPKLKERLELKKHYFAVVNRYMQIKAYKVKDQFWKAKNLSNWIKHQYYLKYIKQ